MKIITVTCGLVIMAGSIAAWHYWDINGFVAVLMAIIGGVIAGKGCGVNLE